MAVDSKARRERLAVARKASGLSKKDIADACDISIRFYDFVEAGDKNPSLDTAKKIADALGVTVDDIF